MNGPKKSTKKEANGMPSLPIGLIHITKTENVGFLDTPIAAHLFTFGPRG